MWNTNGFSKQKRAFSHLIKTNGLAQAYLFSGPDSIGKRTFAMGLFSQINGGILADTSGNPDFRSVAVDYDNERSEITISQIREIKNFLSLKSFSGGYRMVLIDEAEKLNLEASNALLKILEEPPAKSVFILVTSMPGLVLPTILSRCEEVRFTPQTIEEAGEFLTEKRVNKNERELLLTISGGKIGTIQKLLVGEGMAKFKKELETFDNIISRPISDRMLYAKKMADKEVFRELVPLFLAWYRAKSSSSALIRGLLALNRIFSRRELNHRLALENFLIGL